MRLLVTMGYQPPIPYTADYIMASVLLIDWDKKKVLKELTYTSPSEHAPPAGRMLFHHGHLVGNRLIAPTFNELVFIDVDGWKIERVISLPQFNDVHHAVIYEDHIFACATGLQAVLKLTMAGELVDTITVDDRPTWEAYQRDRDYRSITTKPHPVHPNYLFEYKGALWVTRFRRRDAVPLYDQRSGVKITSGNPHDGLPRNGLIYFTTTNGHIVGSDPATGDQTYDLDLAVNKKRNSTLGWCRGLCFLGDERFLVGFTAFRPTKWKHMAHWVMQDGKASLPSRISLCDARTGRALEDMVFCDERAGACIYSVFAI